MVRDPMSLASKTARSLIGMALQHDEDDDAYWECVTALRQYRGRDQGSWLRRHAQSRNWRMRTLVVNILCQLAMPGGRLARQAAEVELAKEVLGRGLRDSHWRVNEASLFGLGHREYPEYLPQMLAFLDSSRASLRHGLAFALGRYPQPEAAKALLRLMRDEAREVRNWATFGLASLSEQDGPAIREGLLAAAEDVDAEIRGEALIGLARRRDERVRELVMRELRGEFHGSWAIDAAASLADPIFLPALEALKANPEILADGYFSSVLADAITACSGGQNT